MDCVYISHYDYLFCFNLGNFTFDHANTTAEMLLYIVLLRGKYFVEMDPLKGICHNTMYTVVGYTK